MMLWASIVVEDLLAESLDGLRELWTRSDQTEVAFEDIPELWELIDAPAPHEGPDS
jgi:hypothetical protein